MESHENRKGVGLVLSGGGGKGAYEIGVWRALDEYGVSPNICAVSGTSVGALNAALFVQRDRIYAEQVWSTISPDAILTLQSLPYYARFLTGVPGHFRLAHRMVLLNKMFNWISKMFADQGLFSKKGLGKLIDQNVSLHDICAFPGPVCAAAFNLDQMRLEYFDLRASSSAEELRDQLLASASIPVVFGKTYVNGHLYWDGGLPEVGDNTPVKPLYDAGYRNIIVVHLNRESPVERSRFPGCHLIEIMPQEDLGGVRGTLNFRADRAVENMERGYDDTVRILEPLRRTGVALFQLENALNEMQTERRKFWAAKNNLDQQNQTVSREIDAILDQYVKE